MAMLACFSLCCCQHPIAVFYNYTIKLAALRDPSERVWVHIHVIATILLGGGGGGEVCLRLNTN